MTAAATPTPSAVSRLRGYQVALRWERRLRSQIFTPPPQYSVSEWADAFRMLTSIASAEPGRWRTDRAPYQRGIMDAFCDASIERVVVMSSAQVGKALALDTEVATPYGMQAIGDLQPGNEVYAADGSIATITACSPVMHNRRCLAVVFDTGERVVVDAEHRWVVRHRHSTDRAQVLSTGEMLKRGVMTHRAAHWRVDVTAPIVGRPTLLPLPPYVLGAWLGDGNTMSAQVTCDLRDGVWIEIQRELPTARIIRTSANGHIATVALGPSDGPSQFCGRGHRKKAYRDKLQCSECAAMHARARREGETLPPIPRARRRAGVHAILAALGVLGAKRIPEAYLRAVLYQRWELLQGIVDTDGYISPKGHVEITTIKEDLARDYAELAASLGLKPRISRERAKLHGRDVGPKFRVRFVAYADQPISRLERKQSRLRPRDHKGLRPTETKRRSIVAIEEAPTVPVKCIAIDSPTHQFLVTRSHIPTHNTEIVLNVIGYFMDQDPAPILVLQPTIEMARSFSKDRLREMLRASPRLQPKIRESQRREADDTILHKQFPGGQITMAGANSPAGLASRPIRVVLNDEVDRFPPSAGDEGDPVSLAKKRTLTFWNRKEGLFSTPTIKDASRIEAAFNEGDQRRYHVPCPHCGHLQHLKWSQLDFESGSYVCESCAVLIAETDKPGMLERGQWIAAKPGGTTASFHLNALYSPWVTWRYLITEFLEAKKSVERLRTFINTVLGETWEIDGEGVRTDALADRRETYAAEVPAGVGVLVAAIDVQKDRLELIVKGFGAGQESWLIGHHRLYGDPSRKEVWDRADALLTKPYQHESGATMTIAACCIDSGDGQTVQHVYAFVRPRQRRGVYATKGYSVRGKPIISRPGRANRYGVKVIPVGTDTAKDLVFGRLSATEPGHPGYMHFPQVQTDGADDEYLHQFGAEKAFIRYHKGVPIREYRQVRDRNEAIDLEVLAIVALHMLGAGVYDQLAAWVAKVQAEGAAIRAKATTESSPSSSTPPMQSPPVMQPPRRPPGGGWVGGWRR